MPPSQSQAHRSRRPTQARMACELSDVSGRFHSSNHQPASSSTHAPSEASSAIASTYHNNRAMFTRNGSPRPSYGYSQKEHTLSHGDDCGCEACADTSLPSIYSADTTVDTLPELDAPGFDSIESRDTEEEEAEAIVLGRGEALLGNVDGWDLPAPRTPLRTVQAGHEDQYPQDRFVQSSWIDKLDSARDEDMGLRANVRESVLSPLQPHSFGARPYALAIAHASTEVHPPTSALKLRTQPSGHVPSQERAAMMPPLSENGKGHDKNSRQHGPSAYDLPLLYAPGEMDSHRARTPAGFPLSPAVGTPDSLVVRPTQTRDAQPPSPALLSPSTPVRGLRKRRSSAQLAQISPAARSSRVRISVRRPALTLRLPTARGPDESRLGEGGNGLLHSPHTPTRARLSPARRLPSQKERAEMVEKQRRARLKAASPLHPPPTGALPQTPVSSHLAALQRPSPHHPELYSPVRRRALTFSAQRAMRPRMMVPQVGGSRTRTSASASAQTSAFPTLHYEERTAKTVQPARAENPRVETEAHPQHEPNRRVPTSTRQRLLSLFRAPRAANTGAPEPNLPFGPAPSDESDNRANTNNVGPVAQPGRLAPTRPLPPLPSFQVLPPRAHAGPSSFGMPRERTVSSDAQDVETGRGGNDQHPKSPISGCELDVPSISFQPPSTSLATSTLGVSPSPSPSPSTSGPTGPGSNLPLSPGTPRTRRRRLKLEQARRARNEARLFALARLEGSRAVAVRCQRERAHAQAQAARPGSRCLAGGKRADERRARNGGEREREGKDVEECFLRMEISDDDDEEEDEEEEEEEEEEEDGGTSEDEHDVSESDSDCDSERSSHLSPRARPPRRGDVKRKGATANAVKHAGHDKIDKNPNDAKTAKDANREEGLDLETTRRILHEHELARAKAREVFVDKATPGRFGFGFEVGFGFGGGGGAGGRRG